VYLGVATSPKILSNLYVNQIYNGRNTVGPYSIIRAACKMTGNPHTLRHVSGELLQDKDVVLTAVENEQTPLNMLQMK